MNTPAQHPTFPMEQKETAMLQAHDCRRLYDYDTKDYTVGSLLSQFHQGELLLPPDYHRASWDEKRQSLFVESILLDLPIPLLLLADRPDGRLEIIDGVQRIQAIAAFQTGALHLAGLGTLTALNGFPFADLPDMLQRRFLNKGLRAAVFERDTTQAARRDLARRMNRPQAQAEGADPCGTHEKRRHTPMSEEAMKKLHTTVYSICEFAHHYGLPQRDAYRHLRQHGGIQFLLEFAELEGTLAPEEIAEDLAAVSNYAGGTPAC